MASGFKISTGADLDAVFAAVGGVPYGSDTGFVVANGAGVQGDIKNRYHASTGGDQRASNTGLKVGSTDLKTLFRDINFAGAPVITVQPTDQQVNETATGSFTLTATGDPTLAYQWRKGGSNLSNGGHYSGVTTHTLTISSSSAADDADYDCVVSNGVSPNATSDTVHYTVILIPVINGGSVETGPYALNEGDTVNLTVTTSAGQNLSYQWKFNGSDIGGATSSSHIFTLSSSNDGTYSVVVSNTAGSDTSSNCVVSIIPPVINGGTVCGGVGGSAPSGGGTYTFVNGGSVASFNVTTSQGGNLSYVWTKNGSDLGINNAQGPVYNPATFTDAGVYAVQVSNGGGSVSASCTLVIV